MKILALCCLWLTVLFIAVLASDMKDSSLQSDKVKVRLTEAKKKKEGKMQRKGRNKKTNNNKKMRKRKRKGKMGRRRRRKNSKGQARKRQRVRSGTVSDICLEQSMAVMKMWKDIISNFEKQKKRMEKQNGTGGNKSGKKGVFVPTARRLLSLGGGNKSLLSCAGKTDNPGALQLKNLTDTLFDCEVAVHNVCDPSAFPQPNMTFIAYCDDLVTRFKAGAKECLDKTVGGKKTDPADACTCWTNSTLNQTVEDAKVCKASAEATAITNALKKCKKTFGKCRKFEDAAITTIMSCTSDSGKLTQKAATLKKNEDAVRAAKAAVKALASSRRTRTASSCTEVVTLAGKLSDLASQFPSSPKIIIYSEKISKASSVTCSEEEKASLTVMETKIEEAAANIAKEVEVMQEQLQTLTGTTVSESSLTAASSSTEAASSSSAANSACVCPTSGMTVSSTAQVAQTGSSFSTSQQSNTGFSSSTTQSTPSGSPSTTWLTSTGSSSSITSQSNTASSSSITQPSSTASSSSSTGSRTGSSPFTIKVLRMKCL